MNLWVRSQDKETLTKVKSVFYSTNEENEHLIRTIVIDNVHNGIVKIGQYATKERALEVLDEIQTILRGKYATSFDYKTSLYGFKKEDVEHMLEQMAVYEMPKE